jgi:hypothetical protein
MAGHSLGLKVENSPEMEAEETNRVLLKVRLEGYSDAIRIEADTNVTQQVRCHLLVPGWTYFRGNLVLCGTRFWFCSQCLDDFSLTIVLLLLHPQRYVAHQELWHQI